MVMMVAMVVVIPMMMIRRPLLHTPSVNIAYQGELGNIQSRVFVYPDLIHRTSRKYLYEMIRARCLFLPCLATTLREAVTIDISRRVRAFISGAGEDVWCSKADASTSELEGLGAGASLYSSR